MGEECSFISASFSSVTDCEVTPLESHFAWMKLWWPFIVKAFFSSENLVYEDDDNLQKVGVMKHSKKTFNAFVSRDLYVYQNFLEESEEYREVMKAYSKIECCGSKYRKFLGMWE